MYIVFFTAMHVCFNVLSVQVGHQSPMKLDLEVNKLGESIVKGIVHQKSKTLSSEYFTYCNVVPNLYTIFSSRGKQKKRFISMSMLLFSRQ